MTVETMVDEATEPSTEEPSNDLHDDAAEVETDDARAGREAAKYRRQLRAAEAERDELRTQLDAARRGLVEHFAQQAGIRPVALWASGVELANLVVDGVVDRGLVEAAVETAKHTLGLARIPRQDPSVGAGGAGSQSPQDSFASAFGSSRRVS